MALIKSISGIRGTIGGKVGENLTPVDIVKFTAAFASWLVKNNVQKTKKNTIVIGRDARISGEMVQNLVAGTLKGMGIDVVYAGLATTPTIELAVIDLKADGGIIITASHNPKQWNALKLLNAKGEFISSKDGEEVLKIAADESFAFAEVSKLGKYTADPSLLQKHIDRILALPLVDVKAIKAKKFKVVVDCVNSVGGIAVPALLKELGVESIIELYCEPNGQFSHNPEPLQEHLGDLSKEVKKRNAVCENENGV